MIRHPALGVQADGELFQALDQNAFKRFVIGIFVKDGPSAVASVQRVIDFTGGIGTGRAWHRLSRDDGSAIRYNGIEIRLPRQPIWLLTLFLL